MSDATLPATVDQLIRLVDQTYPLKNFPATADLTTVHRACGQRDVVEWLLSLKRERDAPED